MIDQAAFCDIQEPLRAVGEVFFGGCDCWRIQPQGIGQFRETEQHRPAQQYPKRVTVDVFDDVRTFLYGNKISVELVSVSTKQFWTRSESRQSVAP